MRISISGALSVISTPGANSASTPVTAPKSQPVVRSTADVFQLAESFQVYQLYKEGQKVWQIASALQLTVEAVNSYLGIPSGKS